MKHLMLVCFALLIGVSASSQGRLVRSLTHAHYTVREGLAQQQSTRIFEDRWGYLWMTTYNGISVFDGKTFETYVPQRDFPNDEKIPISYGFAQWGDVVLLISSAGVTFFHPDGNHTFSPLPDHYRKTGVNLNGVTLLQDDRLYLFNCRAGTKNRDYSFFVLDLNDGTFTKGKYILPLVEHAFADESGIYAAVNAAGSWQLLKIEDEGTSVVTEGNKGEEIHYFHGKSDEFAVHDGSGVYLVKKRGASFERVYMGKVERLFSICYLSENRYLIASLENRAFLWENGRLHEIPVTMQRVNFATADRNGNVWLATENGVYNFYDMQFETYTLSSLENCDIWSVREDFYGNRWFSSVSNGFWRAGRDGSLQRAEVYLPDGSRLLSGINMGYMDGCTDAKNRLWLNFQDGLMLFDPEKGNDARLVNVIPHNGSSLISYYDTLTRCVYAGGDIDEGTLLIAVSEDLTVKRYPFLVNHVLSVCRDANRRLRVGSYSGGFCLNETDGKFLPDTAGRSYRSLVSMCADGHGTLWKGTDNGLFAEAGDGSDRRITEEMVLTMLLYRDRYLIFGENRDKLNILDLDAYHRLDSVGIRSFDRYRGFDVLECVQNGLSVDEEGYVWLPGSDIILRFHPDSLMAQPEIAAVTPFIASVSCKSKDCDYITIATGLPPPGDCAAEIEDGDTTLRHEYNNLKFELRGAHIAAPDSLRFRYRLNGYQTEWHQTTGHVVEFQNLASKTVYLEVQSSINGVDWSPVAVSPKITVAPPFWLSPGGLLLTGGIALALLSATVLLILRYLTVRKQKEFEQAKLMASSIKSRYIPHFTNNVLNSINYLILHDSNRALEYISEFSSFNRRTLAALDKFIQPLGEELKYAESYLKLEILRFGDKLNYTVDVDERIDRSLPVPTMIIQTFCENAVKHGFFQKEGPGHLKIEVCREDAFTVLAVEDDGIGRRAAQKLKTGGTGSGLTIVGRKIDFINKYDKGEVRLDVIDLYDGDGKAAGTRFELRLSGKIKGTNNNNNIP
ncbi:MAG: histidine kinase [Tannerella sp.]|nr:histidine kinase [Tannerella sp.]